MEISRLVLEYLRVLIWPLTVLALSMLFRTEVKRAFARVRKAAFPGGVSVDFQQEVEEVKVLSAKVESTPPPQDRKRTAGIPLTEANARMIQIGLTPTLSGLDVSYYREMAKTDPVLSLAGLRIELEVLTRNLAKGFKLASSTSEPLSRLLSRLGNAGAITPDQKQLAGRILQLCNQAVHGRQVSQGEAEDVIDAAGTIFRDYLAWLSWGFSDNWTPREPKSG
jgi:hypothetical protein